MSPAHNRNDNPFDIQPSQEVQQNSNDIDPFNLAPSQPVVSEVISKKPLEHQNQDPFNISAGK